MRNSALILCLALLLFSVACTERPDAQTAPHEDAAIANDEGDFDLSGQWRWSIDPYQDGYFGFHGGPAGTGHLRYDVQDVSEATRSDPLALYEYDLRLEKTADIPGSWIGHSPEMRHYNGLVWYQRGFDFDPQADERVFLSFGAVNYSADVYLNGIRIGGHKGGFTPFQFEVTGQLVSGQNWLTLGVDSQRTEQSVPPTVTDWETYGGITRPVRLLRRPQTFIRDHWVRLTPDGALGVDVTLDGENAARASVELSIASVGLTITGETDGEGVWSAQVDLPDELELWSPDTPKLYDVDIQAGKHSLKDRIGFRTIEVIGEDILLNGSPIFLRGVSLHEEEIGASPTRHITESSARALLSEIKDGLGGNFVRLAHYPHAEITTRLADEIGLIVWSEIPVYWRIDWDNPETLSVARNMLAENIRRDRNRASIMLWSIANETPISDARNVFLRTLASDVRGLDDTRLVTAALLTTKTEEDGTLYGRIEDPLVDALDVLSVNTYDGWYGPASLDEVDDIRWDLNFNKPLLISEFGAGGFIGLSGETPPRKFSLEYQAEYYRQTLKMTEHISSLRGMSPWILKDFRSPRRQHPQLQEGWNRKGLITETGVRKPAFHVLADHYQKLREGDEE